MTWKSLLAGGLELGPLWVREEVPATPSCHFASRGQCELAQVQDLAVFTNGVAAINLKNGSLNKATLLLIIPLQKKNN